MATHEVLRIARMNLLTAFVYQLHIVRSRESRSERSQLTNHVGESTEMVQKIGDAAGRIWQFVNENPASNLERINKHLKLELSVFCMALGWLAREDKIIFEGQGKELRVSLK
jgi:Winged helix-turn-helix domain (DUF2582)